MKVEKSEQKTNEDSAPKEYFIEGATSVPVVRDTSGKNEFAERIKSELTKK